jgi:hypothetical protein
MFASNSRYYNAPVYSFERTDGSVVSVVRAMVREKAGDHRLSPPRGRPEA